MQGGDSHAFSTNLEILWRSATIRLPAIAKPTVDAANAIAGADRDTGPWTVTGSSLVFAAWVELYDEARKLMRQSVANIYDGADALLLIARNYAETDATAKRMFLDRCAAEVASPGPGVHVYPDPGSRPQISEAR